MNQSKGTSLWVWLTLGLIGLGLNAFASQDISARIKARPAALQPDPELRGTILIETGQAAAELRETISD
jgi:hypothetical protein